MKNKATNDSPFVNPDHAEQIEAREDRYLARSERAEADSERLYSTAKTMGSAIPFGQPILVGHHSEKRDRNYRARMVNTYDKSFEASKKADYYKGKAASVGTGGISSTDPEAVVKLKSELAEKETTQELMKNANREYKKHGIDGMTGFTENQIEMFREIEAGQPDYHKGKLFPSYSITNNGANIRRIKKRIEELEAMRSMSGFEFEHEHFEIKTEDGRFVIEFDGKPAAEIRAIVKAKAFKWSRYQSAWVRKATGNALYAVQQVAAELAKAYAE